MAEFDPTNRGSIWKNEKKTKDTDPDFTGSLNVSGIEFWVSAWKRKPDANPKAPALSFSIKIKEPTGNAESKWIHKPDNDPFDELDTIPF